MQSFDRGIFCNTIPVSKFPVIVHEDLTFQDVTAYQLENSY